MRTFFLICIAWLCCLVLPSCVHYDPGFKALESRVVVNPDKNAVVGMWCNSRKFSGIEQRTSLLIKKSGEIYYTQTTYENGARDSGLSVPEPQLGGTWKYTENGIWLFSWSAAFSTASKARLTSDGHLLASNEGLPCFSYSVYSRLK